MNVGDVVWRQANSPRIRAVLVHAVIVKRPDGLAMLDGRALCGFRPRRYWSPRPVQTGATACHRCVTRFENSNNEPKEQ